MAMPPIYKLSNIPSAAEHRIRFSTSHDPGFDGLIPVPSNTSIRPAVGVTYMGSGPEASAVGPSRCVSRTPSLARASDGAYAASGARFCLGAAADGTCWNLLRDAIT